MNIAANSYLVFQAYGNKDILHECAFALLTLTRQHSKEALSAIEVWIYTDEPEYFKAFKDCTLNLHFRTVDAALLKQWRGMIDFVHRVKIEVLRDFTKDKTGNILYADTDVYFVQPINDLFERIGEKKLVMHVTEGIVHETDHVMFQKLSRFIKQKKTLTVGGENITVPEKTVMWNAGVLGFHTDYKHLLDEVLSFTDAIYPEFHKHVVEQFAFSLYFQKAAAIHAARTHIFHYWNLKEVRHILTSYFDYFEDKNWEELACYSQLIQLPELMQYKINFLQNRTLWGKIRRHEWKPQLPLWGLLVQQL